MNNWLESLIQAADQERLAHAYLLVTPYRSAAERVIGGLAAHLYQNPGLSDMAQLRQHPDVAWVEPASRSRRILVDDLNVVLQRLAHTSYAGGYKLGVIVDADRMNDAAANKFLKTLEEPPGHSLILLVSGQPEEILATIKSRCQILRIGTDGDVGNQALAAELVELLAREGAGGILGALGMSQQLQGVFDQIKGEVQAKVESEAGEETPDDVIKARSQSLFRGYQAEALVVIQQWYRDVLLVKLGSDAATLFYPDRAEVLAAQAQACTLAQCYRRIEQLDTMAMQLERNIPLRDVLEAGAVALAGA